MRLSHYLDENGISDADFGERIGVTGEAVRLWRLGQRLPRALHLHKIVKETAGAVTLAELRPDLYPPERGRAA